MEHDINKMELFKTTVFSLMLAILAELYVVIIENTNSTFTSRQTSKFKKTN